MHDSQGSTQVRIFISSTFVDMHGERDALVKEVFPELRRKCALKGLDLVEVDLRWGVTEEEAETGKVIPICLNEIERCTYFVCLLGHRYGWVPSVYSAVAVEQYPWLTHLPHASLTEIEIHQALLNSSSQPRRSFFYCKAAPPQGHDNRHSREIAALESLKYRIAQAAPATLDEYSHVGELGGVVLAHLWAAIERDYPAEAQQSEISRENKAQEAFGQARERVFIGREDQLRAIDSHISDNSCLPLVLTGESGCGKSALLANWIARYREKHSHQSLFVHYLGSTPDSANPWNMMRRMLATFTHWGVWDGKIPSSDEGLESTWLHALEVAGLSGLVVVIDALNQVAEEGRSLNWLPWRLPAGIRLIVSITPGDSLNALRDRQWTELDVPLLTDSHKHQIVVDYLGRYGKTLPQQFVGLICEGEATSNPLYLKLILDELRVFGRHDRLREKVNWYLEAETPKHLFMKVLSRLEHDFDRDRPMLVRDSMAFLWASRDGLSEHELLNVLGQHGQPLARSKWSPLYLGLTDSLALRGNNLTFLHDCLRQAVEEYYIDSAEMGRHYHYRLAEFFQRQQIPDQRVAQELPWQLLKAKRWEELLRCVTNMKLLVDMCRSGLQECRRYWSALMENHLGHDCDPTPFYRASVAAWVTTASVDNDSQQDGSTKQFYCSALNKITTLLRETSSAQDNGREFAERWASFADETYGKNSAEYGKATFKLGVVLQYRYSPDCLRMFEESLRVRERLFGCDSLEVASCFYKIGESYSWICGEHKKAVDYFEKTLAIDMLRLGRQHYYTANCLWNLSNEAIWQGDYEKAYALRQECLAIYQRTKSPRHRTWSVVLSDQAEALTLIGDYDQALEFAKRAMEAVDELYGSNSRLSKRYRRDVAGIYLLKRDLRTATTFVTPWWDWWVETMVANPSEPLSSHAYAYMARFKLECGEFEEAAMLIERAFTVPDETRDTPRYEFSDNWLVRGRIQLGLGNQHTAGEWLEKALSMRRLKYGEGHPKTAEAYHHIAQYFHTAGKSELAKMYVARAEVIRVSRLRVGHPLIQETRLLREAILLKPDREGPAA